MNNDYEPLSPRESRQFWTTFAVIMLVDAGLIMGLLYALRVGWFA